MENTVLKIRNLFASYEQEKWVLKNVNMDILENKITAIMGPSGCGKSTFIRCIDRMHEVVAGARVKGEIYLRGENIFKMHPIIVRRKIGMVFQKPNPFPTMSIYNNVITGYILNGIKLEKKEKDRIVEDALKKAFLWEEVKDKLFNTGTFLSGGQQQRLCIARALAMNPEVILFDEPTSALDPRATRVIEDLLVELKKTVPIVIVTHNSSQAARISDYTVFLYLGELVEYGETEKVFTVPKHQKTQEYLSGKFG